MIDALHKATLRELFEELLRRAEGMESVQTSIVLKNDVRSYLQYIDGAVLDNKVGGAALQNSPMERFWRDISAEIARQDKAHPAGYPSTRDGVFLGIQTAIHELGWEAVGAWRADRCSCETSICEKADWSNTREEILQASAVLARMLRSIDVAEVNRVHAHS